MIITVFVLGLVVGSFLNVVIYRIDDLRSILFTRSKCPHCQREIKWYDLIPLLSFVLLNAQCRFCKKKISWQYPLVELTGGIIFLLLFLFFGVSWSAIFYAIVFCLLLVVAVYDIKTQYVPERFVWIVLILLALGGSYFGRMSLLDTLIGALIGGGILSLFVFFSKEKWMGSGDIKIGIILGLMLGYPRIIPGLFLSFLLGSIVGIFYIILKKMDLKSALPFTPFLILAGMITLLYGNKIINWYLGFYNI